MDMGYDILAIAAGNGKMQLYETELLLAPIREEGIDYVQGSRYLSGGRYSRSFCSRSSPAIIISWLSVSTPTR